MYTRTLFFSALAILIAGHVCEKGLPTESPAASPAPSASPMPVPSTTPGPATAEHATGTPPNAAPIPINTLTPDILTRLEIFLDSHSFGPGSIDGKAGEFVGLALRRYQMAQGKDPQQWQVDPELQQELQKVEPIYVPYTFVEAAQGWTGRAGGGQKSDLSITARFCGRALLASFPITPGSQRLPAPVGTWKIIKITILPNFRWDEAMLQHGRRSGNYYLIPPGPRNPVGIVWIGLNRKGIGIHGTDNPQTIGRSASHGCIRLANWDAIRLAGEVTTGMTVEIF
jgi:L,D-transpeptidase catalytic domain